MARGRLWLAVLCLAVIIPGCISGGPTDDSVPTQSVTVSTTGTDGCTTTDGMVRQPEYVAIRIAGPSTAELHETVPLQVYVTARTDLTAVTVSTFSHLFFAGVNETRRIGNLSRNETAVWSTEIQPTAEFVGYVEIVVRGRPAGEPFDFVQRAVHELAVGKTARTADANEAQPVSVTRSSPTAC